MTTINTNLGFVIEEINRTDDELAIRRGAIDGALQFLSDDIKKTDGVGKVGYAGVAFGNDVKVTLQKAIGDIRFPNQGESLQNFKHVFLYIEINGGMKLSQLAEINKLADALIPANVIPEQHFQIVDADKERKVVVVCV